jgi:hypothetical protein
MSTALAIASVTHVLKDLLNNGLIDRDVTGATGGNVTVTSLPPDRIDAASTTAQSQLNLFMYRVTPNQGWRNVGLPSHDQCGERRGNPPLALDLHYLLTSYGANELHAEILLGYGMQLLHETPVLSRDAIRRSLAPPVEFPSGDLPPELLALSSSKLAEQIEQVKIAPESLNTEEISKLWAAFQAKYRPTSAYVATVVLIESEKSTKAALPVRGRGLYVVPLRQPVIEKIMSQVKSGDPIVEYQPILAGHNLVIGGRQLNGDGLVVRFGDILVEPASKDVSDKRVIVPIPSGLEAGIQGVQIIHRMSMGSPPQPHRGVESNLAAFVLSPHIEPVNVTNVAGTGADPRSADVELTVKPAIGQSQRVVLILNEFVAAPSSPPASPFSYSFIAPPRPPSSPPGPTENVTIGVRGVKAGDYLVRVQVDGAESPLGIDSVKGYNSPKVTIS